MKSIIEKEPPPDLFPSKHEFPRLVAVLAVASLVAWTSNLLYTSLLYPSTKPFCDTNINSLDYFPDSCEPCPSNGECNDGKLECMSGYQKHGGDSGASPLWRICTIFVLWSWINLVGNVKEGNALYSYTKQRAFDTMDKLLETRLNSQGMKEFKCPDLLAEHYKPYACRFRLWITQHILVVLPICAMLVGCTILLWKVRQKLRMSRRIEELYSKVCEILEENALTSKSVNGECEPWVVASRLRDHLLLPRERKDPVLWKKVEELVQEDSRVDRYPKLVKGESKVVWEWQVEGSLSASKILTKRDVSKTKINGNLDPNYQQHPTMKSELMEPHF